MDHAPGARRSESRGSSSVDDIPPRIRDGIREGIRAWAASPDAANRDSSVLVRSAQLARAEAVKSEYMVLAVHEIWYQLFPPPLGPFGYADLARVIDLALTAYFRDD